MSKREGQRTARIPPHVHCKVCRRPIPPRREFCSNECREKDENMRRRAKKMQRLTTFMLIAMMAIFLIFSLMFTPSGKP